MVSVGELDQSRVRWDDEPLLVFFMSAFSLDRPGRGNCSTLRRHGDGLTMWIVWQIRVGGGGGGVADQ
jgi:hypothetical protein